MQSEAKESRVVPTVNRGPIRMVRETQADRDQATAMIGGTCFILLILFIAAAYAVIWIRG